MPKTYSLKRKRDFQGLLKNGIRKGSKNFILIFKDSENLKFAFMVDTKIIPKANHRVYTKRVMREIVRKSFLEKIPKPLFIGIRPLKDLKNSNFAEIEIELLNLLNQIDFTRQAIRR